MLKIKLFCMLLLPFLLIMGCTPIYVPNTINVPQYDEAGEIHISAYTGSSGFDFQGGVSVSDNIAIQANTSFSGKGNRDEDDYHTHSFGELELSAFADADENGIFTLSTGIGKGEVSSTGKSFSIFNDGEILTADGKYSRAFLQGSAGMHSKFFRGGFACRISYVHFYSMSYNKQDVYGLKWRKWEYFIEPALFLELGGQNLIFLFQTGFSNPVHNDDSLFDYEPLWISFGLKLKINAF
jgi:hypothetical protein